MSSEHVNHAAGPAGTPLRATHEVLRECVDNAGVKKIASALGISASLVYKWCEEPKSGDGSDASGAANPLDRLMTIMRVSDDLDLVHYICRSMGGFFTPNPHARTKTELAFVTETVEILNKFADLMHFAERSLRGDGKIDRVESERLRRDWDRLKSRLEHFITACEHGVFDLHPRRKD